MKLTLTELNKHVATWNLAHEDAKVLESFITQFPHMVSTLTRYKSTYLDGKKIYYEYLVRPPTEDQLNHYNGFMVLCNAVLNMDLYKLANSPKPFLAYAEIEKEQQLIKRTIIL